MLLSAMNCAKGDVAGNLDAHLRRLSAAADEGCRVAVFPEMSLTGSVDPTVRADRLIAVSHPAVEELVTATSSTGVAASFGIAERAADGDAHITQVVADGGRLVARYRKRHLGEDEEGFVPGTEPGIVEIAGHTMGLAVCAEAGVDFPFDEAATRGAEVILFSAAPGLYGRRSDDAGFAAGLEWWESAGLADASRHARRTGLWIALATQAGTTEDEEFPGLAALVSPDGGVVERLPDWKPGDLIAEIPI